jgi:hypothetical protein
VISEGLKKEGAAAFFTPVREHRKQASKQASVALQQHVQQSTPLFTQTGSGQAERNGG